MIPNIISSIRISLLAATITILPTSSIFAQATDTFINSDDGFTKHSEPKVHLGKMLFFDKILSGHKNISCASCHHPLSNTADGLSLGIGEGGKGLGPSRNLELAAGKDFDYKRRIPRNAPALFNLGHREFKIMFHDGRVQKDSTQKSGFKTPAGDQTPMGLDSALAAQALFPVTSNHEMAGESGTNPVADAATAKRFAGPNGVWELLTQRLRDTPDYVGLFKQAYTDQIKTPQDITIVHVANAIAAFESTAFRADNSPFDRFLEGDDNCMSSDARDGLNVFINNCSRCHTGKFQTNHRFHAIAMPQIGPGKGDGPDGRHDFGREQVTKKQSDRYKFKTPSLRNIALTSPYGHNGAYSNLREVIKHHMNPGEGLKRYNPAHTKMPNTSNASYEDVTIMINNSEVEKIIERSEISKIELTEKEINQVIEFLHCLTDPSSLNMLNHVPSEVPSGLPTYD